MPLTEETAVIIDDNNATSENKELPETQEAQPSHTDIDEPSDTHAVNNGFTYKKEVTRIVSEQMDDQKIQVTIKQLFEKLQEERKTKRGVLWDLYVLSMALFLLLIVFQYNARDDNANIPNCMSNKTEYAVPIIWLSISATGVVLYWYMYHSMASSQIININNIDGLALRAANYTTIYQSKLTQLFNKLHNRVSTWIIYGYGALWIGFALLIVMLHNYDHHNRGNAECKPYLTTWVMVMLLNVLFDLTYLIYVSVAERTIHETK